MSMFIWFYSLRARLFAKIIEITELVRKIMLSFQKKNNII